MSGPQIVDCEQGSESWYRARMGIPTASEFSTVLAKGKGGGESRTRKTYLYKLAGEIITGEPMDDALANNRHAQRGKVMEPEARDLYCFLNDEPLIRVGFIRNGQSGCSPDSLIGANGMLEIKTNLPHLLIDTMLSDEFPAEHVAQCQGALWVSGREWIDLCCYWPKMPLFVKRLYRDAVYHKRLSQAIDEFNSELADIVARVRARAA